MPGDQVGGGDTRVGPRETAVELYCPPEPLLRLRHALLCVQAQLVAPAQGTVIGLEVIRAAARDTLLFLGAQMDLERGDDLAAELVLEIEYVAQRSVVTFGP